MQFLLLLPLGIGYLLKRVISLQMQTVNLDRISKGILKFNLIFLEPLIVVWFIWKLHFSINTFFLPFSGLILVVIGFFLGMLFFRKYSKRNFLTLVVISSLANHGYTMGGVMSYFFLGEEGLSKSLIFISYFYFYLYGFLFPWIHIQKEKTAQNYENFVNIFISHLFDFKDYRNYPIYGLFVGLALFLMQIPIPKVDILDFFMKFIVYVSIVLYYFHLGWVLVVRKMFLYFKEFLWVGFIKFLLLPVLVLGILNFIPSSFLSSLDKQIIVMMSFMPSAVYSIITSSLFSLNRDLSSSIFVLTTLFFLFLVFPLLVLFWEEFVLLLR
ncbi:MAG: hypothetical protein RMI35_02715 [Leptospiraceae bacterium]|nr:hypothetical protein [Leptospiraceae bacterium]